MKRIGFIFIVLLLLSLPLSTSATELQTFELVANNDSEKVFKKMEITVDGNDYKIRLKGQKDAKGVEGYSVKIDIDKQEYTVKKLNTEQLQKYLSLEGESLTPKDTEKILNDQNAEIMSNTSWIQVRAITDDPVGEDLVWTTHRLTWNHNGSFVTKNSRTGNCTAAFPSKFGTHWYTDRCEWTQYDIIHYGYAVASNIEADYYNYDFGDNSLRTDVSHGIYIEGLQNGSSNYDVTWSRSGEFSLLLDLDIVIDNG